MAIPPGLSDDPVAQFPATVFDGKSESRPTGKEYKGPEANDWQQIVNEVIAIEKGVRPAYDDLVIWVSPTGVAANATGSIINPYATLTAALAVVSATKTIVCLLPGTYTLTAIEVLPVAVDGLKIIGIGDVIIAGGDVDQAMSLTPGAQGAAFTITLENLKVNQFAAKKGLYIDDTAIDDTVTVNLVDCTFTMDTSGSSIDLLHAVDNTVTINGTGSTLGPLTLDCINASDAFNFTNCDLSGGIVTDAGAVAAAFVFKYCTLKASGMSGGHSSQTVIALSCYASDNTAVETGEFAGSHTETLIAP